MNIGAEILVFVPFNYKDTFLGGVLLAYSNASVIKERDSLLVTALGLSILYAIVGDCGVDDRSRCGRPG
ncbi:MAG: hypothetical protein IPH08_05900 [Rhodocyclaceae bacterium]|nr:hypothetical protein [Rhodocyclaceae bacterium]